MSGLAAALPRLLPLAVTWVQAEELEALASGRTLSDVETQLAITVGVQHPDRVRIKVVDQIPQPDHPELRAIGIRTGLLGPHIGGITFGHAIFIRQGEVCNRLVSHELRHVYQYEAKGSIAAFLATYLEKIVTVGYDHAPLEIDARLYERDAP
jgi:hypothetical protein